MQFHLLITLLFTGLTLAAQGKRAVCNHDNCLRALIATRKGLAWASMASSDCSSFFATSAPAQHTASPGLPIYASACSNTVRYSSACACLTASNITATKTITTIPANFTTSTASPTLTASSSISNNSSSSVFVLSSTTAGSGPTSSSNPSLLSSSSAPFTNSSTPTSTSSSPTSSSNSTLPSSSSSAPSSSSSSSVPSRTSSIPSSTSSSAAPICTNTLTDPNNCGTCGNVCPSGTCENGSCTTSQCSAQTCGGFSNCNSNSNCFCFSSTHAAPNNGFCGTNAVCTNLTPCADDTDCDVTGSTGNICAINTCCPQESNAQPGVCLQGQCGNPATKLMMMAKARRFESGTAAF